MGHPESGNSGVRGEVKWRRESTLCERQLGSKTAKTLHAYEMALYLVWSASRDDYLPNIYFEDIQTDLKRDASRRALCRSTAFFAGLIASAAGGSFRAVDP
jgi:hypothetical protein